jgi:uncharacterized protein YdhG (YjbR/CyaY superfamily)
MKRTTSRTASARRRQPSNTVEEYIGRCAPDVRPILRRIRATIAAAAPGAVETISYGIPAFRQDRIVVYFAAFTNHIGVYPPVKGDPALERAVARYAGEKGSLRFSLDRKIPYGLIARIAKFRARQARRRRD